MEAKTKLSVRVFNLLGLTLFSGFAYLQFNDATQYDNHDPWIWIVLYAIAALFNVWALIGQVLKESLLLWCGFSFGALLFRMQDDKGNLHLDWINPSAYWNDSNQMVQQTNESGGLVIVLLWAVLQLFLNRKKRQYGSYR